MVKITTIKELIRLNNCLIAGIATIIAYYIAKPVLVIELNAILAFLVVFLICAGGQAINDVFDAKIDKNNKQKPIPSGRITRKQATEIALLFFVIGISIAVLISTKAFLIAIVFALLLTIYSGILYKQKFLGNFIVAAGTATTFIFGAATTGTIPPIIYVLFFSAFSANMAREITKDFEDIKKDKGFKKTLPMISKKTAKLAIISYYAKSIIIAIGAGIFFGLNILYFLFIFVTILFFTKASTELLQNKYKKSQKNSKKGMASSLIAYLTIIIGTIPFF